MRIAVLSDIHANYRALKQALAIADRKGFDKMIILGDLLSYGVEATSVIDIIGNRMAREGTTLVRGNHDEFYERLFEDATLPTTQSIADWVQESILHTWDSMHAASWNQLQFVDAYTCCGCYFSHANPFGPSDWTYLTSDKQFLAAAGVLKQSGHLLGVFGHTHRAVHFAASGTDPRLAMATGGALDNAGAIHILNPGSIGQPRDKRVGKSSLLWLDVTENPESGKAHHRYALEYVEYDVQAHLETIRKSALTNAAKEKISAFF